MKQPGGLQEVVPVPSVRYVLVHYHIFKNAGSTIEYVLDRAFGDRFCAIHGPEPDSVLTGVDLAGFLAANPGVISVSSHHLKYPLPDIPRTAIIDCCFLRDPAQRVWSMHKYFQRVEANDEISHRAKTSGLRAFVELLIQQHPQMINDVQVNLLANSGVYLRPPKRVDLERAFEVMDRIAVLGLVDVFDESLTAAEYYLRPVFPIELQYVRQNASNDGDTGVTPDQQLRDAIGERLYADLMQLNQLDLALCAGAKDEVMRRFRMMPACQERLADFGRRCETLRAVHEGRLVLSMGGNG